MYLIFISYSYKIIDKNIENFMLYITEFIIL